MTIEGLGKKFQDARIARGLTLDPLPADDDEFIERRVVPVREAIAMALDDRIEESVSKMTLVHYAASVQRA